MFWYIVPWVLFVVSFVFLIGLTCRTCWWSEVANNYSRNVGNLAGQLSAALSDKKRIEAENAHLKRQIECAMNRLNAIDQILEGYDLATKFGDA